MHVLLQAFGDRCSGKSGARRGWAGALLRLLRQVHGSGKLTPARSRLSSSAVEWSLGGGAMLLYRFLWCPYQRVRIPVLSKGHGRLSHVFCLT